MKSFVVLQWYYNDRDAKKVIIPEITATFGPFADRELANKWIASASTWGGWGRYDYQIEELHSPDKDIQ